MSFREIWSTVRTQCFCTRTYLRIWTMLYICSVGGRAIYLVLLVFAAQVRHIAFNAAAVILSRGPISFSVIAKVEEETWSGPAAAVVVCSQCCCHFRLCCHSPSSFTVCVCRSLSGLKGINHPKLDVCVCAESGERRDRLEAKPHNKPPRASRQKQATRKSNQDMAPSSSTPFKHPLMKIFALYS